MHRLLLAFSLLAACSAAKKPGDTGSDCSDGGVEDGGIDSGDEAADGGSDGGVAGDGGSGEVLILLNELLAGNDGLETDEHGEYEDWIELFNPGGSAVDLGGFGLTDDPDGEDPFLLPAGTVIGPGAFLRLWCDEEPEDGSDHVDLKLSVDGETLTLLGPEGELYDRVEFPEQEPNISWGRVPDGGVSWEAIDPPTPGASND